jgi:hypothetical protein
LSESAGTRTAISYSWRYPASVHQSVMVGVNPPGHFLFYPGTTVQPEASRRLINTFFDSGKIDNL